MKLKKPQIWPPQVRCRKNSETDTSARTNHLKISGAGKMCPLLRKR
jgi:hypothetical protein